ncbi:MAG: hypothetical protein AAGF74_17920 [Pseudomonadota bacterium]
MVINLDLSGFLLLSVVLLLPIILAVMAHQSGRSRIPWFFTTNLLGGVGGLLLFWVSEETRRLSLEQTPSREMES